ncbi:hypothetical protein [Streptomyces sp. ok210]|jgi:hypothetical protein|uniref:hypothetical protein n=1 Tax=Streptomyces sp. ok210 TaxID=1761905 RepID=UPI0008F13F08|nr:hypothetical protein [Streptomyces sp. ok210]SFT21951.1 hypothetical protein SAMN04487982_110141 [Streptomyces sp. ok210]
MNLHAIAEETVTGVLVGFLLGLSRWAYTRWGSAQNTTSSALPNPTAREHRPMGRSGRITPPDLPYGPHRELVELMHGLLVRSGLSGRAAAKAAGVAHGTFQKALSRPELPTLHTTMAIVLALAAASDSSDQYLDDLDGRARDLWRQADESASGPDPIKTAAEEMWTALMRGFGVMPDLGYEVHDALEKAVEWSCSYRYGWVSVWIWVPDWDTQETLDDNQSWVNTVSHALSQQVGKLVDIVVHVEYIGDEELSEDSDSSPSCSS